MTNLKSTKKALMLSVLSLVLCFAMLIGTTFAWFTDSVTSANNIIKSGNLDIELEYWTGTEWKTVQDASDILTNELWEPGVTEVAYLRIANAGSLALKYQLSVNIVYELSGTNVAGETFKLSDYIQFGVVEGIDADATTKKPTAFATREDAVGAVTAAKKISAGYTKPGVLYPANNIPADVEGAASEIYFALVVWMPTTVGNEANHNGTKVPQINLGVNLFATQYTYEEDSYDDQYDADAFVPQPSAPKAEVNVTSGKLIETSTHGTIWMNTGLQFQPGHTYEQACESPYGLWHADFVVTADKDIVASSIILPGYYAAYCDDFNGGKWVGISGDEDQVIKAGTEIRLIRVLSEALGGDITVNYEDICLFGNDGTGFLCGVSAVDADGDGKYDAAGVTITVELRIYEVPAQGECEVGGGCEHPYSDCEVDGGKCITVGTYSYTIPTDAVVPNP